MKGLPLGIFAYLLVAVSASQAQYICATNNGVVAITGYTGPGGAVAIPTNINDLPVTCISDEAFYNRSDIMSLVIPDSVTNLGEYTFYNCAKLANVTLPAGLVSIGDYTFAGCSSLTNVALPTNFVSMGTAAFENCSALSAVTLSGALTNIGFGEFMNCTSLTNITIPNGVTSIGEYAFSGCARLGGVTIPGSVTNISYGAFFKCSSLKSVIIPGSVGNIGQYAFYTCSNLITVRFNGTMPTADGTVFSGDHATAYYTPGVSGWSSTIGGIPTAYWTLPFPIILNNDGAFGLQSNQFGFTVAWATNVPVVVQGCIDLATWQPVQTNTPVNGSFYFSDAQWSNYPGRFYRVLRAGP